MERSVLLATELIPNCDHAGISIVHRNRTIDTPAATDEVARRGDELQYALDEGPCLDAIWHYDTVISANLAEEDRWISWAPRVAAAETQQVHGLRIAALNRAIIGQAQGILMERYTIDPEQAFNVLRRVSQNNNIKLIRVADELVRTRRTPG